MPDILLSNDDLTVLGSPEIVELSVDFGPEGQRGSQIFVGVGDPNVIDIGQVPELNDLYINAAPGADYSFLYQYINQPGGATWVKVIKVNPTLYSKLHTVSFASGSAVLDILISNIITVSGTPLTAENFNVQYQIAHTNPIASSMTVPALAPEATNLDINFVAKEFDGTSWVDLVGDFTVHVFISIMI
jgi:hypothetical protein